MASSGIRPGAWDYLRWKDIKPIKEDDEVIAAKVLEYAGDPEQYYTFTTPEAYYGLKKWMSYRADSGEAIGEETCLMRNVWNTKKGLRI